MLRRKNIKDIDPKTRRQALENRIKIQRARMRNVKGAERANMREELTKMVTILRSLDE